MHRELRTSQHISRPLLLLCTSHEAAQLQQFEALLALTNMLSVGDEEQEKFASAKGVRAVHHLMFGDNQMIQRAAVEALCNMASHHVRIYYTNQYYGNYFVLDLMTSCVLVANFGCSFALLITTYVLHRHSWISYAIPRNSVFGYLFARTGEVTSIEMLLSKVMVCIKKYFSFPISLPF